MKVQVATEQFLSDLAMTKSPHTVVTYGTAMNHLIACGGDREVSEITPNIVPEYVRWLHSNNPVSQNTLNNYLVGLSRFYRWLVLSELTDDQSLRFKDWIEQYHKPIRKRTPKMPDEDDVQALLSCIRERRPTPIQPETEAGRNMVAMWLRDRAVVETLRSTGCRVGELCSLLIGDLKTKYATIIGKGSKERDIFWDDTAWDSLMEYLDFRAADPGYPLFSRHDWKAGSDVPVSTTTIERVLAEWCRKAHVEVITPHQFRHRFGKLVTESLGLDKAQDLLGHASPTTTRIYTANNRDELRQAHETLNL